MELVSDEPFVNHSKAPNLLGVNDHSSEGHSDWQRLGLEESESQKSGPRLGLGV